VIKIFENKKLQAYAQKTKSLKELLHFGAGEVSKTEELQLLFENNQKHGRRKFGYVRQKVQHAIGDYELFDFFLVSQRLVYVLLVVE